MFIYRYTQIMKDFSDYQMILEENFREQLDVYVKVRAITLEKLFDARLNQLIEIKRASQQFVFPKLALTLGENPKMKVCRCFKPHYSCITGPVEVKLFNKQQPDTVCWDCFSNEVRSFDGNFDVTVASQKSLAYSVFKNYVPDLDAPFLVVIDVISHRHDKGYYEFHKLPLPHNDDVKVLLVPDKDYTFEEFLHDHLRAEVISRSASVYADKYLTNKFSMAKLTL